MKASFVFMTVLAMVAMLVGGCVPVAAPDSTTGPAPSTGTIEVRVTDVPAEYNIISVNVTVSEDPEEGGVRAHRVADDGDGVWEPIDIIEGKNPFNLKELEGGLQQVLAMATVPADNYTQIRMYIEMVKVTYSTEVDGATENFTVQAKLQSGKLKFVRPFEVVDGGTTVLLFDFIADESVVFTGATQSDEVKVIFKPVIKLSIEQGGKPHELASVEGTISAVDTEEPDLSVSIIPTGETEAIVLNVNPQTEITLDDVEATLDELDEGDSVTASYYLHNLKATEIVALSPP